MPQTGIHVTPNWWLMQVPTETALQHPGIYTLTSNLFRQNIPHNSTADFACHSLFIFHCSVTISMQTTSMLRSSRLASTGQVAINRNVFQKSSVPTAMPRRSIKVVRAEANNTGGDKGGSITNSGKTEQPDSFEVHLPTLPDAAISCRERTVV